MQWLNNLDSWQQALIATAFTYAMTAAGALLVFICKNISKTAFSLMMSLAAGIMLASSFFSLLLPALELEVKLSWLVLTLGFALGGALIILTDVALTRLNVFCGDVKKRKCAVMCVAVTMHNIPEGLAVGVAFGAVSAGSASGLLAAVMLAVGIGIQNFPEGMCVAFPIRANGASAGKAFFLGQLSGAVEIAAGVTGAIAVSFASGIMPFALAFSAGAMVAVVCSELIPESFSDDKIKATLGVIAGFALMMILDIAFG